MHSWNRRSQQQKGENVCCRLGKRQGQGQGQGTNAIPCFCSVLVRVNVFALGRMASFLLLLRWLGPSKCSMCGRSPLKGQRVNFCGAERALAQVLPAPCFRCVCACACVFQSQCFHRHHQQRRSPLALTRRTWTRHQEQNFLRQGELLHPLRREVEWTSWVRFCGSDEYHRRC